MSIVRKELLDQSKTWREFFANDTHKPHYRLIEHYGYLDKKIEELAKEPMVLAVLIETMAQKPTPPSWATLKNHYEKLKHKAAPYPYQRMPFDMDEKGFKGRQRYGYGLFISLKSEVSSAQPSLPEKHFILIDYRTERANVNGLKLIRLCNTNSQAVYLRDTCQLSPVPLLTYNSINDVAQIGIDHRRRRFLELLVPEGYEFTYEIYSMSGPNQSDKHELMLSGQISTQRRFNGYCTALCHLEKLAQSVSQLLVRVANYKKKTGNNITRIEQHIDAARRRMSEDQAKRHCTELCKETDLRDKLVEKESKLHDQIDLLNSTIEDYRKKINTLKTVLQPPSPATPEHEYKTIAQEEKTILPTAGSVTVNGNDESMPDNFAQLVKETQALMTQAANLIKPSQSNSPDALFSRDIFKDPRRDSIEGFKCPDRLLIIP